MENPERDATGAPLTREAVIEVTGRIEDWKIARIIATGATADEVLEAHSWLNEQGDLGAETERSMAGNVARVYDVLTAVEIEWDEKESGR